MTPERFYEHLQACGLHVEGAQVTRYKAADLYELILNDLPARRQSKLGSFLETLTNTAVGFVGSLAITYVVMMYVPGSVSFKSLLTTSLCTAWSIARGYTIRRLNNAK